MGVIVRCCFRQASESQVKEDVPAGKDWESLKRTREPESQNG